MFSKREKISLPGVAIGAVTGAVIGALASIVLMTAQEDEKLRNSAGISTYVQLGAAMVALVKQANNLIAGRPIKA